MMLFAGTALAATVSGKITNRTTGKPSPGDTVAVIDTAKSMDEIVKVTSDAQGQFQADAPNGGQILLHITHKGEEYFKSVPPGTSNVDLDVYDSAAKVDGIAGEALVLRAETDTAGKTLSVTQNFFLQNASAPPRTQFGGNTLEFYLPKGATITQTLANAPGGLPTNVDVKTIDAASGHYAFTFPIRPGDTRFQVAYTLPYSGKQPFAIKLAIPTNDVAVMVPKTMQFDGGSSFQPVNVDPNTLSYDAHSPAPGQPVQFTISGAGQLPQSQQEASGGAQSGGGGGNSQSTQASSSTRPGGGLGAPEDPEGTGDPWSKYKWLILGGLGLLLAAVAAIMLKNNPADAVAGTAPVDVADSYPPYPSATEAAAASVSASSTRPGSMLGTLKDELFELETDRLAGKLTEAEYAEHKAAFDVVLRRALNRIESGTPSSNA